MFTIRAFNSLVDPNDPEDKHILVIHHPLMAHEGKTILEGSVEIELGKAGSAEITIPPTNPGYKYIRKMRTIVQIMNDNEELFCGRVLHEDQDFNNNKKLYLEGELARLIDAIMPFPDSQHGYKYSNTAYGYFGECITIYNSQMDGVNPLVPFWLAENGVTYAHISSKFANMTVEFEEHEYVTVQDAVYDKIVDNCGGFVKTRFLDYDANGFPRHTIDYVDSDDISNEDGAFHVCGQSIAFSKNLIDLTDSLTAEDLFTVLIPLGKMGETEITYTDPSDGKQHKKTVNTQRVDITTATRRQDIDPEDQGKPYIKDPLAQSIFGNIWKTVVWDEVTNADQLYGLAHTYLGQHNHTISSLVLNAVDLSSIDVDMPKFHIGDYVTVSSWPHRFPRKDDSGNIVQHLQCRKMSIDLLNISNCEYTFESTQKSLSQMQSTTASNVDSVKVAMSANTGGSSSGIDAVESRVTDIEGRVTSIESATAALVLNSTEIKTTARTSVVDIFADAPAMRSSWYYVEGSSISDLADTNNGTLEIRKLDSLWGSMTYYSNDEKTWLNYISNGTLGAWKEV